MPEPMSVLKILDSGIVPRGSAWFIFSLLLNDYFVVERRNEVESTDPSGPATNIMTKAVSVTFGYRDDKPYIN